ncbi:MAG: hypothetical protein IJ752_04630 [Alphaproteobacteria bacterium]|nr:hypothetical protein [Alphaproteobacteria bacterium]
MQRYAKIINEDRIIYAPKNRGAWLNYDKNVSLLTADGYLPVIVLEKPAEDKPLRKYREANGQIEQYAAALPAPTKEGQSAKRAAAYLVEIDPITAQIQRLRDETESDEEKIAALIAERAAKVAEIKALYPYPTEPAESEAENA